MADLKNEIREYLAADTKADLDGIADADSLLEAGVIDSVRMVEIIAHLEATYGIKIDDDDMVPENFDSIDCLASYVASKQSAG